MAETRPARSLSCALMPNGDVSFTSIDPYGTEHPTTISGTREPSGRITGQQSGVDGKEEAYTVSTGQPGNASDVLEHETLPRAVKPCLDALTP